jgi:hypothetical protein
MDERRAKEDEWLLQKLKKLGEDSKRNSLRRPDCAGKIKNAGNIN